MEQAKILKNFINACIQKLMIDDSKHMALLGFHMGLIYWSVFFFICTPLLIFFKPQIGIWFLLFFCWAYYDRNTPRMGGRKSKWFCNLKVFNLLQDYFSNRLIKTANLPAGRNYILAHYPHSVMPFNILSNFLNNYDKVAHNFPGIEMQFVTSEILFFIPFMREYTLAIGGCSCSESSFTYLLRSKPSKGIIVVPGGTAEIQYTKPGGIYTIVKRRGFVRLALATGTPLVPIFTFGETNAWTKLFIVPIGKPLTWVAKCLFNFSPYIFIPLGRGLLPKKSAVNTIIGAPISVPKIENPSKELIDEYCNMFFQALQDLFEKYKHEYDMAGAEAKLIMV